jgi:hypothetical protein
MSAWLCHELVQKGRLIAQKSFRIWFRIAASGLGTAFRGCTCMYVCVSNSCKWSRDSLSHGLSEFDHLLETIGLATMSEFDHLLETTGLATTCMYAFQDICVCVRTRELFIFMRIS